ISEISKLLSLAIFNIISLRDLSTSPNNTFLLYFKRKYNLFASVIRFILLAYVVAIHPMIEITGVLAKGIKT
ncbi:MAG: hypothetical protein E6311_10100, partial [Clostridium perfringens]|nr:hypothetical protein [Clostridium perfringens]MDU7108430.1 hypothetical protein [Clostridium perfringens]MDU8977866.1 hypothetical protein [Clostridium perfringens]